jgi:hypothetical protein
VTFGARDSSWLPAPRRYSPRFFGVSAFIAGPQDEFLLPDSGVRPLSTDHLAVANRKPAVPAKDIAVIRYPCRLSPRSAPLNNWTFALGYGSDLLPLGDVFSLQAVDSVFRAHCFSKETCGCCHVLGRIFPCLSGCFRCTDVIRSLLVRLTLTRLVQTDELHGNIS